MSSSTSPTDSHEQSNTKGWQAFLPYAVPPFAASVAIVGAFRGMVIKSARQLGQPDPRISFYEGLRQGLIKGAPTVGFIVGSQMIFQKIVENKLKEMKSIEGLKLMLLSSAIVGMVSAPPLAVYNGHTLGWGIQKSLRKFTVKQGGVITLQETAFVAGLSAADQLAVLMNRYFGESKAVDYTAAYLAGVFGSLAGHPANTALTRWQKELPIESARQLMWGAARKARAVGLFSVVFKLTKETLNSRLQE